MGPFIDQQGLLEPVMHFLAESAGTPLEELADACAGEAEHRVTAAERYLISPGPPDRRAHRLGDHQPRARPQLPRRAPAHPHPTPQRGVTTTAPMLLVDQALAYAARGWHAGRPVEVVRGAGHATGSHRVMDEMRAIETTYNGYRFRSRTEAKWAVFFQESSRTWEYKPEGFELPIVGRYLPDFRVDGSWIEIKAPSVLEQIHAAPGTGDGLTTGATDGPTGPDEVWALLAKPIMLAVASRAPVVVYGGIAPASLVLELRFHKGDVYPAWSQLAESAALITARSYRFQGVW